MSNNNSKEKRSENFKYFLNYLNNNAYFVYFFTTSILIILLGAIIGIIAILHV